MDSMEVNKVIAAVLTAGVVFMATGFIGEIVVSPAKLAKPAIVIATAPPPAAGAKAPGIPSIAPLLAKADVAKGSKFVHQVCAACHSLAPNGPTIVGPHLYGVVGRPQGAVKGFS
ncbi:MAG: c-type cytochrome, partial [Acetobacteraceae bacterium]